jgi:hypothetical protein
MPKNNIDYSNTIIYKIYCKDASIIDIYVGHTTNFTKRKYGHKSYCNNGNSLKIYDMIRKTGGWDNWDMVEIAKYNCEDSIEARIREQEHFDILQPTLNQINPISPNDNQCWMTEDYGGGQKVASINNLLHSCKICDYFTNKKCDIDKHNMTLKHKRMTEDYKVIQQNSIEQYNCKCGKSYKHRQGLWKHKQSCYEEDPDKITKETPLTTDKDLILMLIKDNNELRKMMMEQQTVMLDTNNKVLDICKNSTTNTTNNLHNNSHNKAFNMNFFLNETCKNAMNIMEFAESIQLQLSDLETIGKVGYIEGISDLIVKKLKELDITERPVHCADKKREVVYVKDEDKWEKEDSGNKKMKKVINKVACKNQRLLPKFKEAHPGCNMAESQYCDQYSKIVIEAMGGTGDNDAEKLNKIVRNIAKEVVIDKHSFSGL